MHARSIKGRRTSQFIFVQRRLATMNVVPLVEVENKNALGEWTGLCNMNCEGNDTKVGGASSVCIVEYGREDGQAYEFLMKYLSKAS